MTRHSEPAPSLSCMNTEQAIEECLPPTFKFAGFHRLKGIDDVTLATVCYAISPHHNMGQPVSATCLTELASITWHFALGVKRGNKGKNKR